MIDVIKLAATSATRAGNCRRLGAGSPWVGVTSLLLFGSVAFGAVTPVGPVVWMAGELDVDEPERDEVRVRFSDGTDVYFLNTALDPIAFELVADDADWSVEFNAPYHLDHLNLWTASSLSVLVQLHPTRDRPFPRVGTLKLLFDLPAWEGTVAQVVKHTVASVRQCDIRLKVEETLTAPRQHWNLSDRFSEFGINLTSLDGMYVDGTEVAATFSSGTVAAATEVASGSAVIIVAKYRATGTVRRMGDSHVIDKTPIWLMEDLVSGEDGVSGRLPDTRVGPYSVSSRMVDLTVPVRGVASHQKHAIAMRRALEETYDTGVPLTLDSCRTVSVYLGERVDVLPGTTGRTLPEARGQLKCGAFVEYINATLSRDLLDDSGKPLTNIININFSNSSLDVDFASDGVTVN